MIDHQGKRVLIECEGCGDVFSGEPHEEWSTVWPAAQREGWKSNKIAGEWLHACPKCKVPT